ncbi:hypothetical protein NH340_JMT03144 [Sarcoptes scabiei]|nr:hypothetical protein NH340_JMT03144 [Sarcoptes scabiei]
MRQDNYRIISMLSIVMVLLIDSIICSLDFKHRASSKTIRIKYGILRGVVIDSFDTNLPPAELFLGIPYASPPIGQLRFMPPVTPAVWSGIRNANSYGPVCPQQLPDIENEATALQRMTKVPIGINRLPVLVLIHGESYDWNAGSIYDGTILASRSNIIVVTINYRLGVLGFYPSLGGGSARGNFGLMDQVAALHWIQENIREFNGDERNVTIIGHGHGAACVNFLMISPMARGLFHRAIMISGSALSPWAIASNAMIYAKNFAKALDCWPTTASSSITTTSKQYHQENVLDCLRKKSIDEMLSIDLNAPTHLTVFGPVIDGIVIPAHPFGLMSKPKSLFGSYELLLGVAKAESFNSFSALDEENGTELGRRDKILKTMLKNLFDSHLKELFLTIVNEYTDWASSHQHPIQSFDSMLKIFSDALIVAPTVRAGLLHTQLSSVTTFARKRTYFFTFSHQTESGDYPTKFGCIHGQDLAYLLGLPLLNGEKFSWFNTNFTNQEVMLSKRYIYYLSNFIKTGFVSHNRLIRISILIFVNSDPILVIQMSIVCHHRFLISDRHFAIDLQLASNDHYQAHRLSYWFNLLPQLLQSNTDRFKSINTNKLYNAQNFGYVSKLQAPISYNSHFDIEAVMDQHHDDNHDYEDDYIEGGNQTKTRNDFMKQQKFHPHNSILSNKTLANEIVGDLDAIDLNKANLQEQEEQQHHLRNQFDFFDENLENYNASFSMIVQSNDLYKWLSLIIAIGCSLLILNVLVFAGFYYHKDRDPFESKLLQSNESKEKNFKQKRPLQSSIKAANELLTRELKSIPPFNRINSISEDFSVKQNTAT